MPRYIPGDSPQRIDTAASDAQAVVGVCRIYQQGEVDGGAAPSRGRTVSASHTTASQRRVVSKCALQRTCKER